MMDKIVVTAADIEKLLAWRDEHNDPVRSMPVPLREVEIQIVESGISIKCFRSDKKLKLYLDSPARKLGHVVFAPLGNGLWKKKVSTLPADCNPTETEQGFDCVWLPDGADDVWNGQHPWWRGYHNLEGSC